MFELFRTNILELLSWTDAKFNLFSTLWEKELRQNVGLNRQPFMYTKEYINSLLSLYFVIKQQDLNLETYMKEDKVIFFSLVCFYLVEDLKVQQQSENALKGTSIFLNTLKENKLISIRDASLVLGLLHVFSEHTVDVTVGSDNLIQKDVLLFRDIILYNDPVAVLGRACMFYYGDAKKTTFKYLKEDRHLLTPELFFDGCFQRSQRIDNTFVKQLFILNYHHLMDIQGRDKIFPF